MTTQRETQTHVYFWGGIYSQWASSEFTGNIPVLDNGVLREGSLALFTQAEQYMMAGKASVFKDNESLEAVLATSDPREQKSIGRNVQNFDHDVWTKHALPIVTIGNLYKFQQDPVLLEELLATGDKIIVEGSPYDKIWGVGLSWDDPLIEDSANWQGTNWLGEAVMATRAIYRTMTADQIAIANPWRLLGL